MLFLSILLAATWSVEISANKMDDKKITVISSKSDDGMAMLGLQCFGDEPQLFVSWRTYLGSGDEYSLLRVKTRIAAEKPKADKWLVSKSGRMILKAGPRKLAEALLQASRTGNPKRFLIEAIPDNIPGAAAEFDLSDLASAFEAPAARELPRCFGK